MNFLLRLTWPSSVFSFDSSFFLCRQSLLVALQGNIVPNIPALWLNSSVVPFTALHPLACWSGSHSSNFHFSLNWKIRFSSLCLSPTDNRDEPHGRCTALHPPFRSCHGIVLPPTFFCLPFSGEASHTYFFRRKVSASRILQVPGALFLGLFQKLFAIGCTDDKNFSVA